MPIRRFWESAPRGFREKARLDELRLFQPLPPPPPPPLEDGVITDPFEVAGPRFGPSLPETQTLEQRGFRTAGLQEVPTQERATMFGPALPEGFRAPQPTPSIFPPPLSIGEAVGALTQPLQAAAVPARVVGEAISQARGLPRREQPLIEGRFPGEALLELKPGQAELIEEIRRRDPVLVETIEATKPFGALFGDILLDPINAVFIGASGGARQLADKAATALGRKLSVVERRAIEVGREALRDQRGFARIPGGGEPPPIQPPTLPAPPIPPEPALPGPSLSSTLLDMKPVVPNLTRGERLSNTVKDMFAPIKEQVKAEPLVAEAFRERGRVARVIDSQSAIMGLKGQTATRAFVRDGFGGITRLTGVDPTIPGAPTIQDVAARLPRYEAVLTPEQQAAMNTLRDEVGKYRRILTENGVEVPTRGDIMEGGFYLPRGRAGFEGADEPLKVVVGRGRRGKKGFEKVAIFDSQAEGIAKGFVYSPFDEALSVYARDAGSRSLDAHIANTFKAAKTPEGIPLAESVADRIDPGLRNFVDSLRSKVAARRLTLMRRTVRGKALAAEERRVQREVERFDSFLERAVQRQPIGEGRTREAIRVIERELSILEREEARALRNAAAASKRTGTAAAKTEESAASVANLKADLANIKAQWERAKRIAAQTPREQGVIGLPGLEGVTFPDELANAANLILQRTGPETGVWSPLTNTIKAFNQLYRGVRSTLDNSAMLIQGLLGMGDSPVAFAKATRLSFQAWWPGGDRTLARFVETFDKRAIVEGSFTAQELAANGLRIGGAATEFQFGQGVTEKLGRLPLIRNANRAFGFFGDSLRLEWVEHEMSGLLRAGRTKADLLQSGELGRGIKAINSATGYSPEKVGGEIGDLLLFAPRFLQSRLETAARAAMSIRPGAPLEQRIARRSLLKLAAFGTGLTVAVNEALGNETDFQPIANGRWNSNFMRIRFAGRDFSIFGTWDSLARFMVSVATGDPGGAIRGLTSGTVNNAWDFITGESFLGERVRDNPVQIAQRIMENFIPFAAQELPQEIGEVVEGVREGAVGKAVGGTIAVGLEFLGGKSMPLSATDNMELLAQANQESIQTDREGLGIGPWDGKWQTLWPFEKARLEVTPQAREIRMQAKGGVQFQERRGLVYNYYDKQQARDDALDSNTLPNGDPYTKRQWRDDYYRGLGEYIAGREGFDEAMGIEFQDPKTSEDKARAGYYELMETFTDEQTGTFNGDGWEAAKREYLGGLSESDRLYVEVNTNLYATPKVREFLRDREAVSPYWDIRDKYMKAKAPGFGTVQNIMDELVFVANRQQPGDRMRRWELEHIPAFVMAKANIKTERIQLRLASAEIEGLLIKWGYLQTPINPVNVQAQFSGAAR